MDLVPGLVAQLESVPGPVNMRALLFSLFISSIAAQLPPNMLGKYKLHSSEGFDDFMSEIGVNWLTRTVSCHL